VVAFSDDGAPVAAMGGGSSGVVHGRAQA
jgi:hypothetical protein